ncbi:hypothetical protein BFG51_09970 [Dietzia alimentaria]|uniref:Uncharacterized protein n=1 Tax=Dietzia maris TaxID=37915 RepID=A0A365P8W2_9ACTN|nr:hypothetical protein BFG51_09970 [Dietzia alimentaria]RBA33806.1 hypothetical protein DQ226_11660 [Dietzia maris]
MRMAFDIDMHGQGGNRRVRRGGRMRVGAELLDSPLESTQRCGMNVGVAQGYRGSAGAVG